MGIELPVTAATGLHRVGGVFAAEAIAAPRPRWHLILADTDVAPTALFEVDELLEMVHRLTPDLMFPASRPVVLIGTEPYCDVNAGFILFAAERDPGGVGFAGSLWERVQAPRRRLLNSDPA